MVARLSGDCKYNKIFASPASCAPAIVRKKSATDCARNARDYYNGLKRDFCYICSEKMKKITPPCNFLTGYVHLMHEIGFETFTH